ncbi:MAG: hypothetical protein GY799_19810 [Desulfobulbaceae bacterium]|nr:hypothetical protein [Desulfobulbaceae bacterium]
MPAGTNWPTAHNEAWGPFPDDIGVTLPGFDYYAGVAGSYGANEWIASTKNGVPQGVDTSYYWNSPTTKGASNVPLFLDSLWIGGYPDSSDLPLNTNVEIDPSVQSGQMWRYNPDRHQGYVSVLFVDFSVRKVAMKQLWTLKWHRKFDTSYVYNNPIVWPDWMEDLPDE